MEEQTVHRDPKVQGGVPVFTGTRVPLKNLFDYLETGETLDQFLLDFPAVERAKTITVIEMDSKRSPLQNSQSGMTWRWQG